MASATDAGEPEPNTPSTADTFDDTTTGTAGRSIRKHIGIRRLIEIARDLRCDDIAVRIEYCGVCHSDLHRIHGMLGETRRSAS